MGRFTVFPRFSTFTSLDDPSPSRSISLIELLPLLMASAFQHPYYFFGIISIRSPDPKSSFVKNKESLLDIGFPLETRL